MTNTMKLINEGPVDPDIPLGMEWAKVYHIVDGDWQIYFLYGANGGDKLSIKISTYENHDGNMLFEFEDDISNYQPNPSLNKVMRQIKRNFEEFYTQRLKKEKEEND